MSRRLRSREVGAPSREDDLGEREQADRDDHEIRPVGTGWAMPKVKRCTPVLTSVPTVPSSSPSAAMASVVSSEAADSEAEATSARTIMEVYSGA